MTAFDKQATRITVLATAFNALIGTHRMIQELEEHRKTNPTFSVDSELDRLTKRRDRIYTRLLVGFPALKSLGSRAAVLEYGRCLIKMAT